MRMTSIDGFLKIPDFIKDYDRITWMCDSMLHPYKLGYAKQLAFVGDFFVIRFSSTCPAYEQHRS